MFGLNISSYEAQDPICFCDHILYTCDFNESVWCQISLKNNDKLEVGCVYRSPNSTPRNDQDLFSSLEITKTSNYSHLLITGDFNCKEIDWKQQTTNVNENHVASLLLECIRDCYLYQHITEPTRFRTGETPSVLDLVLTNEDHMVTNINYMPGLGKNDHLQLSFVFDWYVEVNRHSFKKHNFFLNVIT